MMVVAATLLLFLSACVADENFYNLAHGSKKAGSKLLKKKTVQKPVEHFFSTQFGEALSRDSTGALDNSSGWFPPRVSLSTKDEPHHKAMQPGIEYIMRSYNPDQLATINAFDPRQSLMDKIRAQARKTHDLRKAKVTVVSWEPRLIVVDNFMTDAEADEMIKATDIDFLGSTAVVTTEGSAEVLENTVTSHIGGFVSAPSTACLHAALESLDILI